jgi:hypothetical protein
MKTFPCKLEKVENHLCRYAGNKAYNYGFVSGTASYCYLIKKWLHDINECPKQSNEKINDNKK